MKLYQSEALRRSKVRRFHNAKLSFLTLAIGFGVLVSPVESEPLAAHQSIQLSYATIGDEDALRDNLPIGICAIRISDLVDAPRADMEMLLNVPALDFRAPNELINTPISTCDRLPNA